MLASLINFSARQDASTLKNLDSQPVKGMRFYKDMLIDIYWCSVFLGRHEEAQYETDDGVETASDSEVEFEPLNRKAGSESEGEGESEGEEESGDESNMSEDGVKDEQSGDCGGVIEAERKCEGPFNSKNEDEMENKCNNESESDSEKQSESESEAEGETKSESEESYIENKPDLAMAGVRCPVFSHQVETKDACPDDVHTYQSRAYSQGFHDGGKFKDTVFD